MLNIKIVIIIISSTKATSVNSIVQRPTLCVSQIIYKIVKITDLHQTYTV